MILCRDSMKKQPKNQKLKFPLKYGKKKITKFQ